MQAPLVRRAVENSPSIDPLYRKILQCEFRVQKRFCKNQCCGKGLGTSRGDGEPEQKSRAIYPKKNQRWNGGGKEVSIS